MSIGDIRVFCVQFFFFFLTALENVIKSTESGKLIGVANQKMTALLADNISSGDPSSMLKMVCMLSKTTPGLTSYNFIRFSAFALLDFLTALLRFKHV